MPIHAWQMPTRESGSDQHMPRLLDRSFVLDASDRDWCECNSFNNSTSGPSCICREYHSLITHFRKVQTWVINCHHAFRPFLLCQTILSLSMPKIISLCSPQDPIYSPGDNQAFLLTPGPQELWQHTRRCIEGLQHAYHPTIASITPNKSIHESCIQTRAALLHLTKTCLLLSWPRYSCWYPGAAPWPVNTCNRSLVISQMTTRSNLIFSSFQHYPNELSCGLMVMDFKGLGQNHPFLVDLAVIWTLVCKFPSHMQVRFIH